MLFNVIKVLIVYLFSISFNYIDPDGCHSVYVVYIYYLDLNKCRYVSVFYSILTRGHNGNI
jgi:hypothetical protein